MIQKDHTAKPEPYSIKRSRYAKDDLNVKLPILNVILILDILLRNGSKVELEGPN